MTFSQFALWWVYCQLIASAIGVLFRAIFAGYVRRKQPKIYLPK